MRKTFILLLLVALQWVACQPGNKKNNAEPKNITWSVFDRNDYSISFPSDLKIDTSGANGTAFLLFTEPQGDGDVFVENLNLLIQKTEKQAETLQDFVKLTESQIKTSGKLLESKPINVNGNAGQKMVFNANINGRAFKFLQYDFIKNNNAYVLTYSAEPKAYDNYLAQMQKVMEGFKLK